jgi:hypothetical protein
VFWTIELFWRIVLLFSIMCHEWWMILVDVITWSWLNNYFEIWKIYIIVDVCFELSGFVLKNCFVIFNHLSWMMLDDVNSVWIETMFQFIYSVWILFWWKCYYLCHCMVLHPLSFAVFIHQWMSFIIICLSSGFLKHHCHCVGNY